MMEEKFVSHMSNLVLSLYEKVKKKNVSYLATSLCGKRKDEHE